MYRNYSRLHSVEEKRNIRKSILFFLFTGIFIVVVIFAGLPLIAKFAIFLGNFKKSNTPVEVNDITPPAPPRFEQFPEATNSSSLTVSGFSESGATIIFSINDVQQEIIANNDGQFTLTFSLKKGENTISAVAKDKTGNVSLKTQIIKVVFDNEQPILEINSPANGNNFYGSKQKQINIQGETEKDSSITINDRFVKINEDGTFTYSVSLSEGSNNFIIKSIDKAENLTEKSITLNFFP